MSCGLSRSRSQTVFGEGRPDAPLMFVGDGPGRDEDRQGEPFLGEVGALMNKMIRAMGLPERRGLFDNAHKVPTAAESRT